VLLVEDTMLRVLSTESIMKPSAVIFDTDNTLYPDYEAHNSAKKAVLRKSKQLLNIEPKEFEKSLSISRTKIKENLGDTASSHSRLLYFQLAIENLGLGTRILSTLDLEQTYWRTFLASTSLFPDLKDFLHLLKSEGVTTANITNLTAQIQFRKMVYFSLDEFFDYVVTSEEAGADKPDPKPFKIALEKIKIEPSKVWMIGDNLNSDIKGGNKFNLITMQKMHHKVESKYNESNIPHVVFSNYKELIDYYCSLNS
jgi:putative hydrolase of the HAD superfamily